MDFVSGLVSRLMVITLWMVQQRGIF